MNANDAVSGVYDDGGIESVYMNMVTRTAIS